MRKKLLFLTLLIGAFAMQAQLTYPTFTGNADSNSRFFAYSNDNSEDLGSLSATDWTYELFIKVDPTALIGDSTAASGKTANGACIGERDENFELYLVDDADADFAIKFGRLVAGNDSHAVSMNSNTSSTNLNFDEWIHVAVSRSSGDNTTKFYLNGALVDSSTDAAWELDVNHNWLDFNYMFRDDVNINFFKGAMDNIRVSKVDRYPANFTPDQTTLFTVDANTLLQLDLEHNLTAFDPASDFDKVEIKGSYPYYIKIHNSHPWSLNVTSISSNNLVNFNVYPNPANEVINIQTETSIKNVAIYNILGKLVYANNVDIVNVSNLDAGIYLIKVETEKGIGTSKLVIK